jgi:N-acyl-D-amino-acid deacylase
MGMTLLIKGAKLLGAHGQFPDVTDLLVSGDKISAIGNLKHKSADDVIDAQGMYLAPGFIDVNTEADHYLTLFDHPLQEDFIRQGVTTIIGGQEGASLAPLIYGTLESIEEWSPDDRINVNWRTMDEFLAVLGKRPLGVNFGTLTGHSTIRRAILGEHFRDLTKNELAVFDRVFRESLEQGSFGISFGLKSVYGRMTPYGELKTLAARAAEFDGVSACALRKAQDILAAADEIMKLSRSTGARVVMSSFLPISGQRKSYEEVLGRLRDENDHEVYFDITPFEMSVRPLYRFLPDWAQRGDLHEMSKYVTDEWLAPRVFKDLPEIDPSHFSVVRAPYNDTLVGKTLTDIMEIYELRQWRDALTKLMQTTRLHAMIAYQNVDVPLAEQTMSHPRALIASRGMSFRSPVRRGYMAQPDHALQTFPQFLKAVMKENIMPIDAAIRKITSVPAKLFGLNRRGLIKEGNFADLVGFRDDGVQFVVINGRVMLRDGRMLETPAGQVLRHSR